MATLIEKLRQIAEAQPGGPIPECFTGEPLWGRALSEIAGGRYARTGAVPHQSSTWPKPAKHPKSGENHDPRPRRKAQERFVSEPRYLGEGGNCAYPSPGGFDRDNRPTGEIFMTNPYEGLEPAIQESFRRLSCSGVGTKKADRLAAGLLVASIAINLKRIADAHEPKPKATRRIRRRG